MSKESSPLGRLANSFAERDAIHIAIAPVTTDDEVLVPGEEVGVVPGSNGKKVTAHVDKSRLIGIVDPFLTHEVKSGQQFYVCLYPNTISSLHHVWEHPEFEREVPDNIKVRAHGWLLKFANERGIPFSLLVQFLEQGGYVGDQEQYSCEYPEEIWDHWKDYSGQTNTDRPTYFSCSC